MPETVWLLENTQSPPVVKIVTSLFPKLPAKCKFNEAVLSPPKPLIKLLESLINCRNKIMHGSSTDLPTEQKLEKWLFAVRDLLWLADYYNGHEWALEHISPASVEELQKRSKEK